MKKRKLKLRCYICGRLIKPSETVLLTSPGGDTDRVFVVQLECGRQLEKETYVVSATTMLPAAKPPRKKV